MAVTGEQKLIIEGIKRLANEVQYDAYWMDDKCAERQIRKLANMVACLASVILDVKS